MTLPRLDRAKFPAYVAPTGEALPQMRTLRSLRMITEDRRSATNSSSRRNIRRGWSSQTEFSRTFSRPRRDTDAGRVLAKWDRHTDVDSRGAVLFQLFVDRYFPRQRRNGRQASRRIRPRTAARFRSRPRRSRSAAAALSAAADECLRRYGALDVKWGDVFRFASGKPISRAMAVPAAPGCSGRSRFARREGGTSSTRRAARPSSVPSSSRGRSARSACWDTATRRSPGSPHLEDQLPLMVQKKLLPVGVKRKRLKPLSNCASAFKEAV